MPGACAEDRARLEPAGVRHRPARSPLTSIDARDVGGPRQDPAGLGRLGRLEGASAAGSVRQTKDFLEGQLGAGRHADHAAAPTSISSGPGVALAASRSASWRGEKAKRPAGRYTDRRSHALLDRRCCPILTAAPTLRWDMDLDALRPELPPHPRLGPRLRRAAQGRDPRDEPGAGRADAHRAPGAVRGCAATGARGDAGAGWGGGDLTDGALAQARRAPATR